MRPIDAPTETPYGVVTVSHVCLNDDVVEGLELRDAEGKLKSFSVQYHPEAAAGPHDAAYLFDRFCELLGSEQVVSRRSLALAPQPPRLRWLRRSQHRLEPPISENGENV